MIKKVAAISLILIANLIMLAHAVIPHHHHHETEICVDTSHYVDHNKCHEHSDADHQHNEDLPSADIFHQHEHDQNNDSQCCLVKPVVILPSNSFELECKSYQAQDNSLHFDNYAFLNKGLSLKTEYPIKRFKELSAILATLYPQISKQSFGLRAPPLA